MQINISPASRAQPEFAVSEKSVRTCVHCGFCLATCPTYLLLGDELDSPRGRIYQIKEMFEAGGVPSAETVKHVDRCLSCLACVSTCPSGVDYMHLIDHARAHVEQNFVRAWPDRVLRKLLAIVLPNKALFRRLLRVAALARPFARLTPARLRAMLTLAPARLPAPDPAGEANVFPAQGEYKGRIVLLAGCAQAVLAPQINAATVRLFNRIGFEVVVAAAAGCCGALPHHLGKTSQSHALAKANIEAWCGVANEAPLDAIVVTASGCGTTVKDYGAMFAADPDWADRAARVSALARDVSELLSEFDIAFTGRPQHRPVVAYQSACSLQHGQGILKAPISLLRAAGFTVVEPAEQHICCGSAGTYNVLQPALAARLRMRKVAALEATGADVVASGNVGCMTQLAGDSALPVVHTVELLDWASGGPVPVALQGRTGATVDRQARADQT
ncbi:MAG: glycolate oxidase subunit GlcF [Gammaproteobacteria bacterium]|nr:glycolate oxidase subunit GlcF [Gammaproteobacteria bacterium]MDH5305166.1 glycolate oxidase subunit GlcF [Gammaproteobacteria bacterium]MDH5323434.1 glycolate oxidase subunit GlcF [Gammaproteobacteria bacterium]